MFQKKNHNQLLTQDLSNYGLDPKDWKLVRDKSNRYKIQHKKDQNFYFKGISENSLKWTSIVLAGI